jgi:hypothetical protein
MELKEIDFGNGLNWFATGITVCSLVRVVLMSVYLYSMHTSEIGNFVTNNILINHCTYFYLSMT